MEATTVVDVVTESPTAIERAKNGSAESGNVQKPVIVAVSVVASDGKNPTATTVMAEKKKNRNKNRVQVSNNKKPFVFYLNLAKRCIKQYNDVELSALGMAIPTVVTIAEILKRNGLAIEKRITISTVLGSEEETGRQIEKAKIEIVLGKSETTDDKDA